MDPFSRDEVFSQFIKRRYFCGIHLQEPLNLILLEEDHKLSGLICSLCMEGILNQSPGLKSQILSLRKNFEELRIGWSRITGNVQVCAFFDHRIVEIKRQVLEKCSKEFCRVLIPCIDGYFQRNRNLLSGRYFEGISQWMKLLSARKRSEAVDERILLSKVGKFLVKWYNLGLAADMRTEEEKSRQTLNIGDIILQDVKRQIDQTFNEFLDKIKNHKKATIQQELFDLFSLGEEISKKKYHFSQALMHPSLMLVDQKRVKVPEAEENQYTLVAIAQPGFFGRSKRSIRFKMVRISGWVAVGVCFKHKMESAGYKFESTGHGSHQLSYDGYSWSASRADKNQFYTSWYFNEGDTVTITVDPVLNTISFQKNQDTSNIHILEYDSDRKDKLHFCVSVNYQDDSVAIQD